MLGDYQKININSKELTCFYPYSLNGLWIKSKKNLEVNHLCSEIEALFPLDTPSNKFFLRLIQDKEMLDSLKLSNIELHFNDIYASSGFNLFKNTLKERQTLYDNAPAELKKLGYCNKFLKYLHFGFFKDKPDYLPGEFRKGLTYIGSDDILTAPFVSADYDHMQDNMDEMELFMYRDDISIFTRSALLYYQIMANLPFEKGNEEVARLASQLYLIEYDGLLHYIPLSKYLKNIENFRFEAIIQNDIYIFLNPYLTAIKTAIKDAKRMIKSYNLLKTRQENAIERSEHTIYQKRRLLEILHQSHKTIFLKSEPLVERFNVLPKTIVKRYRLLIELNLIKQKRNYDRNLYYNHSLLNILK